MSEGQPSRIPEYLKRRRWLFIAIGGATVFALGAVALFTDYSTPAGTQVTDPNQVNWKGAAQRLGECSGFYAAMLQDGAPWATYWTEDVRDNFDASSKILLAAVVAEGTAAPNRDVVEQPYLEALVRVQNQTIDKLRAMLNGNADALAWTENVTKNCVAVITQAENMIEQYHAAAKGSQ